MRELVTSLLVVLSVISAALGAWAFIMIFGKTSKAVDTSLKQEWQKALDGVRKGHGFSESTATLYAADLTALSVATLSSRIEHFSQSTERLSKINLLLVCVIAAATLAYTVARGFLFMRNKQLRG